MHTENNVHVGFHCRVSATSIFCDKIMCSLSVPCKVGGFSLVTRTYVHVRRDVREALIAGPVAIYMKLGTRRGIKCISSWIFAIISNKFRNSECATLIVIQKMAAYLEGFKNRRISTNS